MQYSEGFDYAYSFRDYMDGQREMAQQRDRDRCVYPGGVVKRRLRLVEYVTVENLAALWGISTARVKFLCKAGRIVGAARSRTGKGSPWRIPARWDGKAHVVTVTAARKGPRGRFPLSPTEEEVPF